MPSDWWSDSIPAILNRNYAPLHRNETFGLRTAQWDVSKAWGIVGKWSPRTKQRRLISVPLRKGMSEYIGLDKCGSIPDLLLPLLVVQFALNSIATEFNIPVIIDGWHRIDRGLSDGLKSLPAFQFTKAESCRLLKGVPQCTSK